MFTPIQIADNVYSVGCRDWGVRDFHGYSTYQGTTYNAFLVTGEKNILIDTVKKPFADEFLANISAIIPPEKIDILISNHTEMDHTGALPQVMKAIGEDTPIYCSKMGEKNLKSHFPQNYNYTVVGSGDTLTVGGKTFSFLETKMLHWPDSMFTYLEEEQILFCSDAFGQHYCSSEIYDDELEEDIMPHAKKYYANILLPFSTKVQGLLTDMEEMDIKIRILCPDHGIFWRKDPEKIIQAYDAWSKQAPTSKVVVLFDTMWESTTKMAKAIARGIESEGVHYILMNTRKCHRSDIITEILDAGAIAVGSPTLNNQIFPVIADMMTYIKGLKPQNKLAVAFGSYGWSGEAVKQLNQEFEVMKMEIADPGLRVQYVPTTKDLQTCFDLGKKLAATLKERIEQ